MLPLLEKDICVSEERSSRLPVGMMVSRPSKAFVCSCGALSVSAERGDEWLVTPRECSSWTTIAGRLGVRDSVGGEGGSLVVVPFDDVKAESLRSSSSERTRCSVLAKGEDLGPGEVRGRRTLLSQAREAGLLDDVVVVVVVVVAWDAGERSAAGAVSAVAARAEDVAGSSIMAASGASWLS